jgi:hypothetical protein
MGKGGGRERREQREGEVREGERELCRRREKE